MSDRTNAGSPTARLLDFLHARTLHAMTRADTELLENHISSAHIPIATTLSLAFLGKIIASDTFVSSMGIIHTRQKLD